MKVLYCATAYPVPLTNGRNIRIWGLLQALHRAGHEVTLVCFREPSGDPIDHELQTVCADVIEVPFRMTRVSDKADFFRRLRALLSAQPYTRERFRSRAMQHRLEEVLHDQPFELVIADSYYAAVNLPAVSAPLVMNSHNVDHQIMSQFASRTRNPLKKVYARAEVSALRKVETEAFRQAPRVWTCSAHDARLVNKLAPACRVSVIPNVIDVSEYRKGEHHNEDPGSEFPVIVHQGALDWFPNQDSLLYFCRAILPRLEKEFPPLWIPTVAGMSEKRPGVRVVAAGRNPSPELLRKLAHVPAVTFTGTVPDLRPIVAKATVCVVPLRIGSGTRLKILEAAAMGKAIVSTTLGAEGLDFEPNREIMIADTPKAFAEAVAALIRDPGKRARMGAAAKARVLESYSLEALTSSIESALAEFQFRAMTKPVSVGAGV